MRASRELKKLRMMSDNLKLMTDGSMDFGSFAFLSSTWIFFAEICDDFLFCTIRILIEWVANLLRLMCWCKFPAFLSITYHEIAVRRRISTAIFTSSLLSFLNFTFLITSTIHPTFAVLRIYANRIKDAYFLPSKPKMFPARLPISWLETSSRYHNSRASLIYTANRVLRITQFWAYPRVPSNFIVTEPSGIFLIFSVTISILRVLFLNILNDTIFSSVNWNSEVA